MDDGARWTQFKEGLPAVPVTWIIVPKLSHDVVISTYGRGLFILNDITRLEQGDQVQPYAPSDDPAWADGPSNGNLVIGSEAAHSPQYWTFNGAMNAVKELFEQRFNEE